MQTQSLDHGSAGVALGNTARISNIQGAVGCAAYAAYLSGVEVGVWGPDSLGYLVTRTDQPVTRDDVKIVYVARP